MPDLVTLIASPERLGERMALSESGTVACAKWSLRRGEAITVCCPEGVFYRARYQERDVIPFERLYGSPEPPFERWLYQALPNRERMLWIIQKAVELGVTHIQPMITEKSYLLTHCKQDKSATWPKVALRAAKQCRRAIIPEVRPPAALHDLLLKRHDPHCSWILFDIEPHYPLWSTCCLRKHDQNLALLIGPEGGWGEQDHRCFSAYDLLKVSLGERVLRTETAALAALALLL
ncbi:RsmE family RNA methyltransferase [Magnetococcales bacterium HHB-1]